MIIDLKREATLEPTIQFQQPLLAVKPQALFLSGATGFVGAYLLHQLLCKTTAQIYCLVRSETPVLGQQRLKASLEFYQLWQEEFGNRLIPVVGDLSQSRLGLSEQQFRHLATQIEAIYHNGAQVNTLSPYVQLKATNVGGTVELLRLAALGQTKPFHFVSTVAVFFSQSYHHKRVLETELPQADATLKGGYKQSKWVAEQLVWQAKERGLPVCVYRLGRVVGDSRTGILENDHDLLWKIVKGCILLKKYPEVTTRFNMIPINYVVQAIVHISQQPKAWDKAFHLVNPTPISWLDLWQQMRTWGYAVEPTPYDSWVAEINQQAAKHQLFSQLRLLLRSPIALFNAKPQFDDHHTQAALAGSGIVCPPIQEYLTKIGFNLSALV